MLACRSGNLHSAGLNWQDLDGHHFSERQGPTKHVPGCIGASGWIRPSLMSFILTCFYSDLHIYHQLRRTSPIIVPEDTTTLVGAYMSWFCSEAFLFCALHAQAFLTFHRFDSETGSSVFFPLLKYLMLGDAKRGSFIKEDFWLI